MIGVVLVHFFWPDLLSANSSLGLYSLSAFLFAVLLGYLLGSLRRDTQVWHLVNSLKQQIHDKEIAQASLQQADLRLKRQQEALATLTANQLKEWHTPEEVFQQISQLSADTLEVERVSFWLLSEDRKILHCADLYLRSTRKHAAGEILQVADFPIYFQTLANSRVIAANDALTHPATQEYVEEYLPSYGIGAILDGTIRLNEKIVGIISHEHVGNPREWTLDEQSFVGALTDLARLTIETHRRRLAEEELLQHQEQLEALVRVRTLALENTAKTFGFLVERAPAAIMYTDINDTILDLNLEAVRRSGYSKEYAIGKTSFELFALPGREEEGKQLLARLLAGEKIYGQEMQVRNADGTIMDISVSKSLEVDSDGNQIILTIAQDMSLQKAVEVELLHAREAAESADRIKSMFVASMSHELRTPLNSIIGFLGVVLQGMSGEVNDKQKEQLGRAYQSARHLLALISDVIDISKIEAGFLQVYEEKLELLPLLMDAEHAVNHIAEEKNLQVSIDCSSKIILESDRKRIYQVILNVLSNAVKYTERGTVQVKVSQSKAQVTIAVKDTGIGIDEVGLAKLFTPFERAESRLRVKTLGTGLGLYLTRKILTQLLGGTIEVKSKLEEGSVFTIKVPIKMPKASLLKVASIL